CAARPPHPSAPPRPRAHPPPPVEIEQLLVADAPGEADPAVGARLPQLRLEILAAVPLPDDHRLEERLAFLDTDEHLDELLEPLHRDEPARGRDQRRRRLLAARREAAVDARWHHRDAFGLEPQLLDELPLRRLGERDARRPP